MRSIKKSVVFLFFLSVHCLASAEIEHPFFVSSSGSGGASLNEDFSYLINPALLSFHQRKKIAVGYSFLDKKQTGVLSFLDSRIRIPVALTYQRWWSDSFRKNTENKIFLSSSFKLSPVFSLGFSFKRNLESPFLGNGSLGSFFKLSPQFGMALFFDNMLKEENKNLRLLTLSGAYRWQNFFSLQTDISKSAQKKWILKGGFESLFHPLFSFQLGAIAFLKELDFKELESHRFSGGLNFHSPNFVLQYGLQMNLKEQQHSINLLIKI